MDDLYSAAELVEAAGLSSANQFHQLQNRGHFVPSAGRPGHGVSAWYSRVDVLQARLLVKLGQVGVPPHRAAMFWPVVCGPLLEHTRGLLLLAARDNGTDTDFRLVLPGGDTGMDTPDAPPVLTVINLAALKRDLMNRLMALRAAP